jgi:glutamine---fructose-6-phosphate transaminase (isomerizing)
MRQQELPIIEGPYIGDILAQPRALADTLAWLSAPGRWRATQSFVQSRSWRRIVLTGMGSSLHGLHPLRLALVAAGQTPLMLETAELLHYDMSLCDADTLLIVVSQSGASAEAVRLLDANRRSPVIGVTNTEGSPLAQRADHLLLMRAGPESTVSCKTYVSALLVLQWLGAIFRGDDERDTLAALEHAPALCQAYLRDWRVRVQELVPLVRGVQHLFLAGRGPSLASACTGALIIKESTRLHAEGMSSAAFRHGPLEMIGAGMRLLVFEGLPGTRPLNLGLVSELGDGLADNIGEGAVQAALRLPPVPPALLQVLEILPVQMLTLAIAALKDQEAGRFQRATKVTDSE